MERLQKYILRKSNYKNYIFLGIDVSMQYIRKSLLTTSVTCYAEAGFLGHQNDAQQFTMTQQIGVNGPLHFPEDCVLLADKIYPNRQPTVTTFTTQQINRKPEHMKRKCRKCNRLVSEYSF